MDMPKKIFVNEFLDGAEQGWTRFNTEYIRADLVNELIEAVKIHHPYSNRIRDALKALETE